MDQRLTGVDNTDTKLLIYGLFQKGRVLAQDAIENLNGTIRRVSRNVKRWKSLSMVRRWTALGVVTAQKEFRRIKRLSPYGRSRSRA